MMRKLIAVSLTVLLAGASLRAADAPKPDAAAKDAATTEQSTPSTPDYKRGKGWYRLEFVNTGVGATKWLQFDAASIAADVWLNGQKLGQHRGAFTAFRFNITDILKPGKNVLLVKTDNSPGRNDGDPTAIAPLSGDFNMSGGL